MPATAVRVSPAEAATDSVQLGWRGSAVSIQVQVAGRACDGLVFGLLEGLFEFPI